MDGNDRRRDEFDPTLLFEKRLAKGMVMLVIDVLVVLLLVFGLSSYAESHG